MSAEEAELEGEEEAEPVIELTPEEKVRRVFSLSRRLPSLAIFCSIFLHQLRVRSGTLPTLILSPFASHA